MRRIIVRIMFAAILPTFTFLDKGISETVSFVNVAKGQMLDRQIKKKIYRHGKLGFSFEYHPELTVQEFSDGICLIDVQAKTGIRIDICIDRVSTLSKRSENMETIKVYRTLRHAEDNKPIKLSEISEEFSFAATYTKIKNETVAGYAAYRILSVSEPKLNKTPLHNGASKSLPPYYDVSVYFKRGGYIWEIRSMAYGKDLQEKTTPFLETVLESLKFSTQRRKPPALKLLASSLAF